VKQHDIGKHVVEVCLSSPTRLFSQTLITIAANMPFTFVRGVEIGYQYRSDRGYRFSNIEDFAIAGIMTFVGYNPGTHHVSDSFRKPFDYENAIGSTSRRHLESMVWFMEHADGDWVDDFMTALYTAHEIEPKSAIPFPRAVEIYRDAEKAGDDPYQTLLEATMKSSFAKSIKPIGDSGAPAGDSTEIGTW
jgi:hypothetical protein